MRETLHRCGREPNTYNERDFDRFFLRVYQFYGSPEGYDVLPDAIPFLEWATKDRNYLLGVTSNTACRMLNTVLPMKGLHDYFSFFVCSQDVKAEKPDNRIFDEAFDSAEHLLPGLRCNQILHIGDNPVCDYAGARAAGIDLIHIRTCIICILISNLLHVRMHILTINRFECIVFGSF